MYTPNCEIHLSGLAVSSEDEGVIRLMIQQLQNQSPSDSLISLHLVKNEDNAMGSLSISSRDLNLKLNCDGQDSVAVVKKLSSDLQLQLKTWVKERVFV